MEDIIDNSIINSYYVLTKRATVEDIVSRQEFPIFFINPGEGLDKNGLDTMLDYFI